MPTSQRPSGGFFVFGGRFEVEIVNMGRLTFFISVKHGEVVKEEE